MKTITILSGKGGVGKSTISASLALVLAQKEKIVAVDCDVDAANLALLFGIKSLKNKEIISTNYKAFVNKEAKKCKNIVDNCAFDAITWNEKKEIPQINEFLCEGCGTCKLLCPDGIVIRKINNAVIGEQETKYGFPIVSGQLKMGESGSGNVVSVVKERATELAEKTGSNFLVVDSAPGIGCPVIASVKGSDYVVAVTEPTPAAFSALKRALEVVEHFGVSYGIVINKWDMNKRFVKNIEDFAKRKNIKIIKKIPYSKDFIQAIIMMKPVIEINSIYKEMFVDIVKKVKQAIK